VQGACRGSQLTLDIGLGEGDEGTLCRQGAGSDPLVAGSSWSRSESALRAALNPTDWPGPSPCSLRALQDTGAVYALMSKCACTRVSEDFTAGGDIHLSVSIDAGQSRAFIAAVSNATSGRVVPAAATAKGDQA